MISEIFKRRIPRRWVNQNHKITYDIKRGENMTEMEIKIRQNVIPYIGRYYANELQGILTVFFKRREQTNRNIVKQLSWMIKQLKWQYDNEKEAMQDVGSQGGYSPELTEAINLLTRLKKQE